MAKRWESRRECVDRLPFAATLDATEFAEEDANSEEEALQQTAQMLLRSSPFQELHTLDVILEDHALRVRGQVISYFHKQIAQETVRSAAPGVLVENEVEVHPGRRLH